MPLQVVSPLHEHLDYNVSVTVVIQCASRALCSVISKVEPMVAFHLFDSSLGLWWVTGSPLDLLLLLSVLLT